MLEPLDSLVEVERFLRRKLQSLSRANNLTISEWQLLKRIVGGENTQSVLSSNTSLDVSTLSRQLARLTAKNFLKKEKIPSANAQTRKTISYSISETGKRAFEQMNHDYQVLTQKIFSPWTEEEYNLLKILLNRLDTSLQRTL
ncbi:MarR family winged helix-turn-helix transcriptional regulator [Ligilactobacillus saerimneri]|uniref:MarR family winged helix-turn-helix transcriptional regulator n=1 Tax=Ligilactobacillus saerimneri TaxID=228229 RepID=UPI001C115148|nr:MarR family winged helix-turn-helix transcriptional regulator [Ligilactobacillus saerimneri]MBU5309141.1 MarR family winged helix-turn-helix transcriptional regulator [Ligilactobacillus saerimneri]MCZ0891767.1 MarR family winged helix-turn-helix transcriptional regulator [Ligilactobacillus saerimneri]MDI9205773.1 MarR family winged helix-turn-helix transcriptional regulator [Ligilactobacillus saerimneri]MDY4003551.1 MarR family winged helix-turn-helix transcriptional regulator [Ligilactobaci